MDEPKTTSDSELLRKLALQSLAAKTPPYKKLFKNTISAQVFSIFLLLILTIVYLFLILIDWNSECENSCQKDSFLMQAVYVDEQTLAINYVEPQLKRILMPAAINEIKNSLDKKFSKTKSSLITQRITVAKQASVVLSSRLNYKYFPEVSAAMDAINNKASTEADIDAASIYYPTEFYRSLEGFEPESHLTTLSAMGESSGVDDFYKMKSLLLHQKQQEDNYINQVKNYIGQLDPQANFQWLANLPWVVQLTFWTWFGVLINNIVWLIRLTKSREETSDLEFSPETYITLFSRLIIAPFISVCFLAMIMSGITKFDISDLDNLPAFLVAAFFLGFMSESVTMRMRQLFNKLVDSIEYQKQPKLSIADIEPTPVFSALTNTSLSNVEANMRSIAKQMASKENIQNEMVRKNNLNKP